MNILALDTTGPACSVAVLADGVLAAHCRVEAERGHAVLLMPMVESVRQEAGLEHAAIDLYGVTVGPGSYTGIRIGLAAARGMALAAARPLFGMTATLAVARRLARLAPDRTGTQLAIALDTKRRDDTYLQIFDAGLAPTGDARAVLLAEAAALLPVGPLTIAGNGAPRLLAALAGARDDLIAGPTEIGTPDAIDVAEAASEVALATIRTGPTAMPQPLYLRAPHVTRPGRQK